MQTIVHENLQYIVIAFSFIILIQFIVNMYLLRRIKILFRIANWLLIFENFISQVFRQQIETYVKQKEREMAEQEQRERATATNIYKRYENNVASSPITMKR